MSVSEEQYLKIIDMYLAGESIRAIADAVGCTYSQVVYARQKSQIKRRRHKLKTGELHNVAKLSDAQVIEMINRYKAGAEVRDIVESYGIHQTTVRLILRGKSRSSEAVNEARAGLVIRDDRGRRPRKKAVKPASIDLHFSTFNNESGPPISED